jgi:hypothetical protein
VRVERSRQWFVDGVEVSEEEYMRRAYPLIDEFYAHSSSGKALLVLLEAQRMARLQQGQQ